MSFIKSKSNKVIYSIINITEDTKEKECINADKKNEKKYQDTLEKLGTTTKAWENTGVTLNMVVPPPPTPNNYDRLLDHKKKHVLRPAILQSEATIFLLQRGYILGNDYEACDAIDVSKRLREYEEEQSRYKTVIPPINKMYHNMHTSQYELTESSESSDDSGDSIDTDKFYYPTTQQTIKPTAPPSPSHLQIKEKANTRYSFSFPKKDKESKKTVRSKSISNNKSNPIESLFSDKELKQFEKNYKKDEKKKMFQSKLEDYNNYQQQHHPQPYPYPYPPHPGIYPNLSCQGKGFGHGSV